MPGRTITLHVPRVYLQCSVYRLHFAERSGESDCMLVSQSSGQRSTEWHEWQLVAVEGSSSHRLGEGCTVAQCITANIPGRYDAPNRVRG